MQPITKPGAFAQARTLLGWRPRLLLAGARLNDRLLACIGALIGIAGTAFLSALLGVEAAQLPLLVAPVGASAVLLFALPASPLAQPWPVIGGNMVSAVVGGFVASQISNLAVAAGLAVALSILVMSLLRCLHPPGGGTALLPILAGPQAAAAGTMFVMVPTLNALLLVALGWFFHGFTKHSYPHRAGANVQHAIALPVSRFRAEDIDTALEELGDTLDVSREDLDVLFKLAERHAAGRSAPR